MEVVGGTHVRLGEMYRGSKSTRQITLRSVGRDTLRISELRASCGCTATLLSADVVAPGDSAVATLTFNSTGFSGTVTKHVSIFSNDASAGTVDIDFTAKIVVGLELDPPFLTFKQVGRDSTYTQRTHLKNSSNVEIKILDITPRDSQIVVHIRKTVLKPGERTEVVGVLTPRKSGYIQGEVGITSDFGLHPDINLLFNAFVR